MTAGRTSIGLAFVVAIAALPTSTGKVRASDVPASLAQLFEAGQKNTPPAVGAARAQYNRLKRANPDDPRIDYAFGLVLANQRRYEDAIEPLLNYVEARPDDLAALRVGTWAQLHARHYDDVLTTATALAKRFPAQPTDQPPAANVETARFLGTIFGYLELVRPRGVDPDDVAARKNAVLARLGETYLAAFDEGRDVVGAKLAQLEADRDARLQRAAEAAAGREQETKALLDESREKIAIEREVSQASSETMGDARRELDLIRQQYQSLLRDRERLGAQIITLQAQLSQLQTPTSATNLTTNTPNGRGGRAAQPGDIFQRSSNASTTVTVRTEDAFRAQSLAIALAQLNVQAFEMDRRLFSLQARAAELAGSASKQRQALVESREIAEKVTKRANVLEKKLARDQDNRPARPASATGQMVPYSTYVELEYEQESQRILGWFGK